MAASIGRALARLASTAGQGATFDTAEVSAWSAGNRRVLLYGELLDVDCWDAAVSLAAGDIVLTLSVGNTTAVLCKLAED